MRVEWECHVYKEFYEEILSLIIQAYMTMLRFFNNHFLNTTIFALLCYYIYIYIYQMFLSVLYYTKVSRKSIKLMTKSFRGTQI